MGTSFKNKRSACFCLKARRLSATVTKFYDQELSPSGVTIGQFSVLLNIAKAENCSVSQLADLIELDKSTLTRNLKPLFAQGLVEDAKEPGSRNCQLLLTVDGQKTLALARLLWAEAQKKIQAKLGKSGQEALEIVINALKAE